jgi:hypothetical protein
MVIPVPGQPLDDINNALADPLLTIVAHLATAPSFGSLDILQAGDLTEANFPGYAPVPVKPTLENAMDFPDFGQMDSFLCQFTTGAIVAPQTITCFYLTASYNNSAPVLRAIVFFPNPIVVYQANQVIEQNVNIEGLLVPV